jgi:hypothetical protein
MGGVTTVVTVLVINTRVLNADAAAKTIIVGDATNILPGMSVTLTTVNPPAPLTADMTKETATVYKVSGTLVYLSQYTQPPFVSGKTTLLVQNDPPLTSMLPSSPLALRTTPYRIIRGPRPIAGEDGLTLPTSVGIQLAATPTAAQYDPPHATTSTASLPWCDILFSPAGAVVGQGAGNNKIILWVRDVSQQSNIDNNPVLISIYTRSGLIAAHPVDVTPGGDPYSFTVDGKSSEE